MSIRDGFAPEVGGLGKKIERPAPEPKRVEVAPGIFKGPDGKLETDIPPPPLVYIPTAPVWPFGAAKTDPDVVLGDC